MKDEKPEFVPEYQIKTFIDRDNEAILQTVEVDGEEIMRHVMRTLESQTHDALVELGWTPPVRDVQ